MSPQTAPGLLFRGIRRPLRPVVGALIRQSRRIERVWRRLLRRLEAGRGEYDSIAAMDLAAAFGHLSSGRASASGDLAYRTAIERCARRLVGSGVPEDHAIAAVALYLEASLGYLEGSAEIRALLRLTSATQGLVAAGYGEERLARLRRLEDRERQKFSRDLHDEVGADLVVLKLYIEVIAADLAKGRAARVRPKLMEALALVAHATESVRRLTMDLGPAFLDALGFRPTLRAFVRQFALGTGIKVELDERGAPASLPASHETALYRVLRGALSNVAKHSAARHAKVTLSGGSDMCVMVIEDDGKGFDVGAPGRNRSFGLTAMRERVRSLHGRFAIESRSVVRRGRKPGTRIEVRLPFGMRAAS